MRAKNPPTFNFYQLVSDRAKYIVEHPNSHSTKPLSCLMEQLVGSLLNAHLAYGDAVLLELLGQDGVEEGVAARVEGQDEDGEDLGLLQGDQVEPSASRQGEKGDGSPKIIIKILNFTALLL